MDIYRGQDLAVGDAFTPVNSASGKQARAPVMASVAQTPAIAMPLSGVAAASAIVGPFAPDIGRAVWLALSGAWTGRVQVLRSIDGGATKLPLTVGGQAWAVFTGPANEPIAEETVALASYYLSITLNSGSLTYRMEQ